MVLLGRLFKKTSWCPPPCSGPSGGRSASEAGGRAAAFTRPCPLHHAMGLPVRATYRQRSQEGEQLLPRG